MITELLSDFTRALFWEIEAINSTNERLATIARINRDTWLASLNMTFYKWNH